MAPPTNITAATAAVLTMNTTVTLDVSEAAAPLHEVWYKYTATSADTLVGYYAAANPAGTYVPVTAFFQGSPTSLQPFLEFTAFVVLPVQFTLVAGTTYFYRIRHNGAAVALTHPLQLSITRAANGAIPAGSLLINDDAPGWPMVILSATGGAVLQTRLFPAGETGTVLPSGFSIWHDSTVDPEVIRLYDAALTLRATAAWSFRGSAPAVSSNRTNRFYLGDPGGTFPAPTTLARVTTMDTTGVMGPTIWTLPEVGLNQIAVNLTDTILYHYGQATGAGALKRWDLVNNVPLTDFAGGASAAGYVKKQYLVLGNGTLVLSYAKATTLDDSFLRHYAADGTLINTFALGALEVTRLAHGTDDPASIWAWCFLKGANAGVSRFLHIRLSDGVTLTSFDSSRYEGGGYVPTTLPAPPPPAPAFGHSPSCPFIIFPPALPPYTPPGAPPDGGGPPDGDGDGGVDAPYVAPSYHLDARYIRRLRRAPHVNNEHARVFFKKFELDLERGQGLATGQGSDPMVLLRVSRDGGQTWGEEQRMSAGALGAYTQRVIARRLGQARDTVFEVTVSDPIAWSLVGAWLDLEPGTN